MPVAGSIIQIKRSTAPITSGALEEGEFGMDITEPRLYFSPDGTAVYTVPTESDINTILTDLSGKQPLDSDLTALADGSLKVDYLARVAIQRALGLSIVAETCDKAILNGTMTMTASRFYAIPIFLPRSVTLTGLRWFKHTIGTFTATSVNNRLGLYTYSGGTLTLVKGTTDDDGVWKQGNDMIDSKAFTSTYDAVAGPYWIGFLWRWDDAFTTAPSLKSGGNHSSSMVSSGFTNSGKWAAYIDSQTDIPSSIAMSTMTALTNTLWFALY